MGSSAENTLRKTLEEGLAANPRARIKTGTYTGNDADNRNIDIGIDLTAKNYVWLIVTQHYTCDTVQRPDTFAGDQSRDFSISGVIANMIQAYNSTGFQIGTHNTVNSNAKVYTYIAIWSEP